MASKELIDNETKEQVLATSDAYWKAQFDHDADALRGICDPHAPFVHMGITMDLEAEADAIDTKFILTMGREDSHVDVRLIDGTVAIVLRQLVLTALVRGKEAVNPFVATETYHKQADGSWKLISFVYTHIVPEGYEFRYMS